MLPPFWTSSINATTRGGYDHLLRRADRNFVIP